MELPEEMKEAFRRKLGAVERIADMLELHEVTREATRMTKLSDDTGEPRAAERAKRAIRVRNNLTAALLERKESDDDS